MKPALLLVAILGCAGQTTTNHQTNDAAACSRSDGGTPYTPGTVACGDTGACPADGTCVRCNDMMPPGQFVCGAPPGATCYFSIGCDGPEDCAPGQRCYAFESSSCDTGPPSDEFYVVCHADGDCDCGDHCDSGQCRH